jgi:ABC-type dipeptide/oligopeptide/nickel transport system permease component
MVKYLLGRMAQLPIALLGLFTIIFIILRVMPGDPAMIYLGDSATAQAIQDMREKFGLDRPIHIQYGDALSSFVSGDLGRSFRSSRHVTEEIMAVLPNTVILAGAALIVSSVLGVSVGIVAALRMNRFVDYFVMSLSILCISIPAFWLALILILVFSFKLGLFPVAGVAVKSSFIEQAHALVLPVISLSLLFLALVARMTRSSMAEVMHSDFIRTVRAKGASERLVVIKHALRNAMLPVVTVIGLNTGLLFSGAVLTETVFARPGIGKLLVDSFLCNDYPLVQGIILLIGVLYVVVNLLVDVTYAYLDPRIKYRG